MRPHFLTLLPIAALLVSAPIAYAEVAPFPAPWQATLDAVGLAAGEFYEGLSTPAYEQWIKALPAYQFSPETSRVLVREFGTARLFNAEHLAAPEDAHAFALDAPAMNHTRTDGSSVSWAPWQARWTMQPGAGTFDHAIAAPHLHAEDQRWRFDARHVGYKFTTHASNAYLYYGDAAAHVGGIALQNKSDGTSLALENLLANVHIAPSGPHLLVEADLRIASLGMVGQSLENLHVRMHVEGLDATAVAAFNLYALQQLALQQMAQKQAGPSGKAPRATAMTMYGGLGWGALKGGATLVIDEARFRYKGRTASLRGQIQVAPVTKDEARQGNWGHKVSGHFELIVPTTVLRAVTDSLLQKQRRQQPAVFNMDQGTFTAQLAYRATLEQILASGFVRLDGEDVVSSIDIRSGKMFANGKPVPLLALAAPADAGADNVQP
jgi:hypothetical protein